MTGSSHTAWSADELTAFHTFLSELVEAMGDESKGLLDDGDALLEGDWKGAAASKFSPGWEEWKHGWNEVVEALKAEDELVVEATGDYTQAEEENQTQLEHVPVRFNW
ncbi:MAG: WXG100 family type VII secretion target [Segniliparus sp.]|uniref:WXG100 family type VII secretion target n=1 Tax=Segniliparus sp. TaxID=2804064 RepID=UPI003F3A9EFB